MSLSQLELHRRSLKYKLTLPQISGYYPKNVVLVAVNMAFKINRKTH